MAADEARFGADLTVAGPRLDVYGQLRLRQRDVLSDPNLPAVIASLPADQQFELSGGVRQHGSLFGMTLGVSGSYLSGNRTRRRPYPCAASAASTTTRSSSTRM